LHKANQAMTGKDTRKTMLLTGASRGIGHATVRRFNREGWRVITCSRHPFPQECPWGGGGENHVQIDLADPSDTIRGVEVIREKLDGRLDALVNNAGIYPKGPNGERLNTLDTDLRAGGHVLGVSGVSETLCMEFSPCGFHGSSVEPSHQQSNRRNGTTTRS
jgi:NAD(P)-dependent dehydrogenase (short-subunit alcohol dehydrogenase family)